MARHLNFSFWADNCFCHVTSHPQHLILMTPATNSTSTREISQKHPTLSSCTGEEENTWALHCLLADYRTSVSWQKTVDLKIKLCKGLMSALKYQKQGQLLPETASLFTHKTPHKKYRNCGRTDENVKKTVCGLFSESFHASTNFRRDGFLRRGPNFYHKVPTIQWSSGALRNLSSHIIQHKGDSLEKGREPPTEMFQRAHIQTRCKK